MEDRYITIKGFAKVPVYKTVKFEEGMDLEEVMRDDLSDLLYTSLMEKEDEIELDDLDYYEEW